MNSKRSTIDIANTNATNNPHSRSNHLRTQAEMEAEQRMHALKGRSKYSGIFIGSDSECHVDSIEDLKFWIANFSPSTAEKIDWAAFFRDGKFAVKISDSYRLELTQNATDATEEAEEDDSQALGNSF